MQGHCTTLQAEILFRDFPLSQSPCGPRSKRGSTVPHSPDSDTRPPGCSRRHTAADPERPDAASPGLASPAPAHGLHALADGGPWRGGHSLSTGRARGAALYQVDDTPPAVHVSTLQEVAAPTAVHTDHSPASSCLWRLRERPWHTRITQPDDRLVGPSGKVSASRAEGPGFESRLRRDFFGVESYQ